MVTVGYGRSAAELTRDLYPTTQNTERIVYKGNFIL